MEPSCQIAFVGMDGAEPIRLEVRAWLQRLGHLTEAVKGGHVLIEGLDGDRKPPTYRVRMDLPLADGAVVTVTHSHPSNAAHDDVYVAIRNAFRAARRQLEDHFRTRPSNGTDKPAAAVAAVSTVEGLPDGYVVPAGGQSP